MIKKVILIILSSIMLISCYQSSNGKYNPIVLPTPDPNINGEYVKYDPMDIVIYAFGEYDTYKEYFVSSHKITEYKWKKEGEKYYHRVFNANEGWRQFNLVYIDANTIMIDGVRYIKK
ncbi:hypothetical protein [Brachyspira alvinipulli]|uniref:hypothetical protein n=1 Tax=Brachyspira alvinipulli TaxID=84379 RepID=UPI000484B727|nr:hypothetical protein [Brachyspira alvinipulli]